MRSKETLPLDPARIEVRSQPKFAQGSRALRFWRGQVRTRIFAHRDSPGGPPPKFRTSLDQAHLQLHEKYHLDIRNTNRSPSVPEPTTATANMSDAGEIEVENTALYEVLPKDVVKEVGNVKLFNKWDYDVEVRDISLTDYISLRNPVYVTHTAGRYATKRFRKANCPIIERLTNSLMMHGRNNGKKLMAVRIVAHAFEIIHLMTDQNPIQVAVDAIVNCGPREDSTRIGSAGTVRRQAVDVSPLRRVNQAIALLTTGAREASFRNVKSIAECLAEELINAAKGSSNSYAIKKKDELERVAKSNR
ncbi:hypothetical protein MRS44_002733 [Fusarium solani]|nr:hypothetical protein MRS44_002733 [Fusarium solani]